MSLFIPIKFQFYVKEGSEMRKKRETYSVDDLVIIENAEKRFPNDKKAAKQLATFAITLNHLLDEQGIDQELMAKDIGISEGSLSSYRNGKSEPGLTAITKIADYLGEDCHYLITGVKAENKTLSSDTGLSDKSIDMLHHLKQYGNAEEQQTIAFINRVLSDPGKAPGNGLLDLTLFSWLEQYVTLPSVNLYDLDPEGRKRVNYPAFELTSGMTDRINPADLFQQFLMNRIRDTLEAYRKEEEKK